MNFLAPLFLAGALAVALPVILHLIRRTTRERKIFSSIMFLKPTPPRLTRRSRLEHLLLLLLRCAAICLLALGFARPFVKYVLPVTPTTEAPKHIIVLVDTSASMRRANLWSQARDKAEAVLARTGPADHVALFTFDRQLTPLVTFDEWNALAPAERLALARGRLAAAEPGWFATRLDQAIIRAAELVAEGDVGDVNGRRQIVVVSDFQEGSKFSALQGQEWPKGVELVSERVTARTGNAGLQLLAEANSEAASAGSVRVRVSNEAEARAEQFSVGWARNDGGLMAGATDVYVPAGQSRVVVLPAPDKNAGADRIVLRGDDEAFDNTVFTLPPEATRVNVLYLGDETATNARAPLYFVRRALSGTPRQTIDVIAQPSTAALAADEAGAVALFIVTGELSLPAAAGLRRQLEQGKTVLFAPVSAAAAATLGRLVGKDDLAADEVTPRQYAMLGEIDFRHPLFSPFADARYSDFTKIHFWKYRRLDATTIPNARVVARFDNGDAAIVDVPVGKGRMLIFTSGWHPADSQLALSTKFVPLLCSVLELSGGLAVAAAQFHVGDAVPVAAAGVPEGNTATIMLPDASTLTLAAGETNFAHATMPGIYQVKAGGTTALFAVNLEAAESRTTPLPLDELERLGVPVTGAAMATVAAAAPGKPLVAAGEIESRQKLWRWFIAATLGVLLLETAIAGWTARQQSAKVEAAV